ncbi:MAG: hypothetical protein IJ011_02070 [Clostridia bacterium]|nr:hypothetical protein [Clostridia bacterium]
MKRDLFVFAGQSNMMGASVYPPKRKIAVKNSFEYKHKMRRLGKDTGDFVLADFPSGEFSYSDIDIAYAPNMVNEKGESLLDDYAKNTFFCPSMSNLKCDKAKTEFPFDTFSEATAQCGVTLAPILAEEWENEGGACAYAHIAKGGVNISHFMTDKMAEQYAVRIEAYNKAHGTHYSTVMRSRMTGAADYFIEKCRNFFDDAQKHFQNDVMENKCFFWLQGESDAKKSIIEYEIKLDILWGELKSLGFTHFFCIRVDFFGNEDIWKVMQAQENFVSRHTDAYMLTRAASYFTYAGRDESEWFVTPPTEEYQYCRDSFYGYSNQHINEKGFAFIAERAVKNLRRILINREEPLLEEENIQPLNRKE